MFRDLVSEFNKEVTTFEFGGKPILIKKYSAYDKLMLQKIVADNGPDHPASIVQMLRGGINEDLSDLTDEQLLSISDDITPLVLGILEHNGVSADDIVAEEAGELPAGGKKAKPRKKR